MKKPTKKKKPKPRLPIEAALKLRSHPVTAKKGEKGYDRRRIKQQTTEIIEEEKIK
ncbi:MAG: hypothetical protein QMC83_02515 [Thermodesulfovibrionales bacterium]|nr:hypothetical protein [Thermodesulfovibrionales bacterium]